MNKQPVSYFQTDLRWADVDYSTKGENTTIGRSGCGPTCMAMVIATWVDKNVTPVETCEWSLSHGYKALNQGTYYSYFKPQGAVYGIEVNQLNGSNLRNMSATSAAPYHQKVLEAVHNGDLVIACMGKGLWTSSGHFILLWDVQGDTAYVNDPASNRATRTRGSFEQLKKEVKYYFVCKKPNIDEEDEDMDVSRFKELWLEMRKELQDNDCSDWSKDGRDFCIDSGIIQGGGTLPDGEPNYMYHDLITREQLMVILKRYHDKFGG